MCTTRVDAIPYRFTASPLMGSWWGLANLYEGQYIDGLGRKLFTLPFNEAGGISLMDRRFGVTCGLRYLGGQVVEAEA